MPPLLMNYLPTCSKHHLSAQLSELMLKSAILTKKRSLIQQYHMHIE